MKSITYQTIPNFGAWKSDSKVKDIRVRRKHDPILLRIDNIIRAIETSTDNGEALYLRFELFFSTNFWLKSIKQQHTMEKMQPGREPAVRALFQCNAKALAASFDCGVQALPNVLEQHFGRTLSQHGRTMDIDSYHYFKQQAEREKFKLFYKGGVVYQLPWRDIQQGKDIKLVKPVRAESAVIRMHTKPGLRDVLKEDWAFFVMSIGRELYMTPHHGVIKNGTSAGVVPKFHSSIMSGMPVSCAGSICIKNGIVTGIRNDSGHYQPTNFHLLNVLQHLSMMGVSLQKVTVYDYAGAARAQGDEFLAGSGNWKSVRQRMVRNDPVMRQFEIDVKQRYNGGRGEDFRTLVRDRYGDLKVLNPQGSQEELWSQAHREVALALGEISEKWWKMASSPPIPYSPPRPKTGHGPRPKPTIPGKANRPRINPRSSHRTV